MRRARRTGLGLLAAAAAIVSAAWAIPPLLDWGRFRTAIAAFAGAELGHKVVIGGDVALRLLPEPTLTATDVTVPDSGDGMSARIGSLRLEIGILPLLAGRLAVRDLVLGSPVLTLPWPLPGSIVNPGRPRVPHAFAAHVENGTLLAGKARVTGITAAIHGGPEPSEAQEAGPAATFAAEGFAVFAGQRWRFTTALGAPDADNVAPVDLAMQGLGPASATGASLQGTLADGVLQGRLRAAGSDLSLLMPASALAWRADAPFTTSGERLESSAVSLSLGGAPATGAFTLQLAAPTRLDGHLNASSLDLDGWSHLLSVSFAGFAPPAIPLQLDISADTASLLGGSLSALSFALVFDGRTASLENAQAVLPGGARLDFSGQIGRSAGGTLAVDGPATLRAPDLRATLAWLRPLAPPLLDTLPAAVLRTASLSGAAHLAPGHLAVGRMQGQIDGDKVMGGFDLAFGPHPRLAADASFDHLALDDWLRNLNIGPGTRLVDAVKPFLSAETELHLRAATADWRGQTLSNLVVDGSTGAGGLRIATATASLPDVAVSLSGGLAADGRVLGFHGRAMTQDSAKLLTDLPPGWRYLPALWHGAAALTAAADGPPNALGVQLHAEAGDLVMEADQQRDTLAGTSDTTFTLRHPGIPFLLDTLGLSGSEAWLGSGSMALLAHVHAVPGFASVNDFSLAAADLHLHGHGTLATAGAQPAINLDIEADTLPLPGWADLANLAWLQTGVAQTWQGQVHVAAADVGVGGRPAATQLSAELTAGGGNLFADLLHATAGGSTLSAQAAIDSMQKPAAGALRAHLTKTGIGASLAGTPLRLDGSADLDLDLSASFTNAASLLGSLSGTANLFLRNAQVAGLDLPLLDQLLLARAPPARAALQQALTTGTTKGLSGLADLTIDHGAVLLNGARLSSTEGSIALDGRVDLPARTLDVTLGIEAATPDAPRLALRLSGPFDEAKADTNLGRFDVPPRKHAKKRVR